MKIKSLMLINHDLVMRGMQRNKIFLDFSNKNLIIFCGDNGSGKSSIMNELNPFYNTSVWIPKEEGTKEIVYYDEFTPQDTVTITYHAYPSSSDNHNMKCYIKQCKNGVEVELNEEGLVTKGVTIICDLFKIDKKLIELLNISEDNLFIVKLSTSERLNLLNGIVKPLDKFKSTNAELSQKNTFFTNTVKSQERILANKPSAMTLESMLKDKELTLQLQESQLETIKNNTKDIEVTLIEVDKLISEKASLDTDIADINNAIKQLRTHEIFYKSDNLNKTLISLEFSEYGKLSELTKVKSDKELELHKIQNQIDALKLSTIFKDGGDVGDEVYTNLKLEFDTKTKEELDAIKDYQSYASDITVFMNVMRTIPMLRNEVTDERIKMKDVVEYIEYDKDTNLHTRVGLSQEIQEREKIIESLLSSKTKNAVFQNLYNLIPRDKSECSNCNVTKAIINGADSIHAMTDEISDIKEKISKLKEQILVHDICVNRADKLKVNIRTFDNLCFNVKNKFFPDFDYIECMLNEGYEKRYMDIVNDKYKEISRYQSYLQSQAYRDAIAKLDISSEYELKNTHAKITNEYKEIMEKFNEQTKWINNIKSMMGKITPSFKEKYSNMTFDGLSGIVSKMTESKITIENRIDSVKGSIGEDVTGKSIDDIKSMLLTRVDSINTDIKKTKHELQEVHSQLREVQRLAEDLKCNRRVAEEISTIYRISSKVMTSKITDIFMNTVIEKTNAILQQVDLPYRIYDKIIDESTFRIPVLKTESGKVQPDVKNMSAGEKGLVGLPLALGCIDTVDMDLNYVTLDEIDAFASENNRMKFATTIVKRMMEKNTQLFCVTHNSYIQSNQDAHFVVLTKGYETLDKSRIINLE